MKKISLIIIFLLSIHTISLAQTDFNVRVIANNLDTPWEILWGPDNYIWMTERYGRISRINPISRQLQSLVIVDEVFEDGERGMMGLALHPDFTNNPYVYVVYNIGNDNSSSKIKVVRFIFDGNILKEPITIIENIQGWWNHNGSRLWITDDLKLFVTVGDAANTKNSQDLNTLNGKILRMNLDGTIPSDNPFPNSYIYSFGHRNPQGFVIVNGKIYSSEHGPSTDDEINIIEAGKNYGWPNIVGYCNTQTEIDFCKKNNTVEPLYSLTPEATLAIAGLDFYDKDLIPEWKNSLLVTALKDHKLVQLKLNESGDSVLFRKDHFEDYGRLRDLCISPDGKVYIASSNKDGRGSPSAEDDRIIEISRTNTAVKKNDDELFLVYPNPGNGSFNIISNKDFENAELIVSNVLGIEICRINLNHFTSKVDLKEKNGGNLLKGIYYVILHIENKSYIEKIIINE